MIAHVRPRPAVRFSWGLAALAGMAATGCERGLDTDYGAIRGESVNGVSAFVQLVRDAGRRASARQFLPAEFDVKHGTVVVFDERFDGLPAEAASRLHGLFERGPRTLLLVLRDSDATIAYLQGILAEADLTDGQRSQAEGMLVAASLELAAATATARPETAPFCDALEPRPARAATEGIEVRTRAADDRSPRRVPARWPLARLLDPGPRAEPLWEAEGEPLLVRLDLGDDVLLVLASAAPLLNGGLVDPGNRELAETLVALLPPDDHVLVVGSTTLDGGGGGEGDAGAGEEDPSPWRLLAVQPLPWVLAQGVAAMGLFCWCTAPIFGRPRQAAPGHAQDFGHHVEALAGLVSRGPATADAFCIRRLAELRQASPTVAARVRPRRRRHPT